MIKYTNIGQAPKLTATAVALQVNGITDASTDAEKLTAVNLMMEDVGKYSNLQLNQFLIEFTEKVLISAIFKRAEFKSPLIGKFFKEGTTVSAAKEIFDSKLLETHDFDASKRYPDSQQRAKNLVTILHTVAKKYVTNTVSFAGLRASFASEQAYGAWAAKQVELLTASMNLAMFRDIQKAIKDGVKNEIVLDAKFNSWDLIFVEITRIANSMKLPSKAFNVGYTAAEIKDAKNENKLRTNVTNMSDMIVLGSPDLENALKGEVSPIKFHNSYFKLSKFNSFINVETPNEEIILLDKNGAEGYFRINEVATQNWAANLTLEYFLHFWYVFGIIPWANGVRIKFTTPTA